MTHLPSPPRWLRWTVVAFVAGGIFVSSVITPPGGGIPELGPLGLVGLDKWLHAVAYAGLGFVLFLALLPPRTPERALVGAIVLAAAYGLGIELVQGPLPTRSLDPVDATVNAFGAILGGTAGISAWLVLPRLWPALVERN